METIHGFDFQAIQIDRKGTLKSGADELAGHVKAKNVSDVVIICHGFRNDDNDARSLYTRFLKSLADNRTHASLAAKLAGRTFAVGGIFWPSMVLPEPNESDGSAQSVEDPTASDRRRLEAMRASVDGPVAAKLDKMLAHVDNATDDQNARLQMAAALIELVRDQHVDDTNEAHAALAAATPEELCTALVADRVDVAVAVGGGGALGIPDLAGDSAGTLQGLSVFDKVFGFVPKFVNLTTFLLMFERCGDVGQKGISQVVRRLRTASPKARIHLVGHSLGGRAVTACAKALLDAPAQNVDTMMLLEAAYSHFGLSPAATAASRIQHPRGHFRDVIEKKVVKGPILATHSEHDSVVAFAYTPMAAISLNNARAIGDENSPFGGIGRNGVLDTAEAENLELNQAGQAYTFSSGKIHNLNGSRKIDGVALIASHGDVTSPAITWAFASLVASV
jgi:hypothetical protein